MLGCLKNENSLAPRRWERDAGDDGWTQRERAVGGEGLEPECLCAEGLDFIGQVMGDTGSFSVGM